MKIEGKNYCDTSRVYIAPISKDVAKEIIVKKHYTHAWTMCRYALGIFYKTDEVNALGDNEKLIGCLVYGFPVGARAANVPELRLAHLVVPQATSVPTTLATAPRTTLRNAVVWNGLVNDMINSP